MIKLNQHSAIAGRFQIEKHTVDESGAEVPGSRHVATPWTNNLITDSGLDNMSSSTFMRQCSIGAGNAEPSPADVELGSTLATTSGSTALGPRDVDAGFNSIVGTYVFGQGEGVGIISELGVRPTSGPITTRALIRDQDGNPTTITKGPMDVLTVTYQLREYPDLTDTVSQVENPHTGVTYDVVSRGLSANWGGRLDLWHRLGPMQLQSGTTRDGNKLSALSSSDLLPPTDSAPSSSTNGATTNVPEGYVSGSFYQDMICTFEEDTGNASGGIGSVSIGRENTTAGQPFFFQASFDPPIDKDNTKTLIITLRKSWGRYEP